MSTPIGAWFGEPWPRADWRAPVCEDDALRVPVPVGERCSYCSEDIGLQDAGTFVWDGRTGEPIPIHKECSLRSVVGPVAYLEGRCAHADKGGSDPCEPDGMTIRESAFATAEWIQRNGWPL